MRILSCEDLVVKYDKVLAVNHVSFSVEEGDYLCIVGENGAGKSTLMKAMLGLLAPSEGKIRYNGIKPTEIGYLPQQTPVQRDFPASVGEVVLSGCQNGLGLLPFYKKQHRRRADEVLATLGMQEMKKRSYRELSGGQQQRTLLARALCATGKMLLLDEPVAGLDPVVAQGFYGLIKRLNRERGTTVVMISHDVKNAVDYAGKILHMETDKAFFGSTQEYRASAAFTRISGETEKGGEADA